MITKDKREHYYYVCRKNGIQVIKSFNKKIMRKELGITDDYIICRTRHYDEAYTFAFFYSQKNEYETRPEYLSITGNDTVD